MTATTKEAAAPCPPVPTYPLAVVAAPSHPLLSPSTRSVRGEEAATGEDGHGEDGSAPAAARGARPQALGGRAQPSASTLSRPTPPGRRRWCSVFYGFVCICVDFYGL
ncbi:hypothetical protein [Oryza sativa Japonica Group]|uniref:Os01g0520180 protein n=3 Tax=Oryza TaxID=4527 RepID=A0A0P0V3F9_ORYSJ|nr:hypothetical protein EE612_003084 [Oryza sativa]KAF2950459.1 hypothetical protein DAI22_01g189500 [Oryza sativa Japonica Group]BAD73593.1 hypothetical protein [Oryza sativa Japonica Group]BAD73708.1 hypothetical protein [Oryza sativa Japonica Group]BAS72445.1 Os01g0520180 [Oryza sativa Japonica Group]